MSPAWRLIVLLLAGRCVAQTIASNPASVVQAFQVNAGPSTATVSVGGSGSVSFTAATESGGNWLSVTPASGPLPLAIQVGMDSSGLPDGTYLGSVSIGTANVLPVTITVGDPGPRMPAAGIVNAASYQGGAVSPGELVTLFGTGVGPKIPFGAQVWDAVMTTKLAGTRVWFDNTPAPLVYAYPNQLAAVVPYNVAGKTSVQVQVENMVSRTPAVSIPVQDAIPALFTADASGRGQIAALNQDGSSNSSSNPAAPGSIVVLFATGAGIMTPSVPDGTIVSSTLLPAPVLQVKVAIGGQNVDVLYDGAAPQLVAGVMQVNARVPTGIGTGNAPVVLTVGNASSPLGCTISVR